MKNKRECHITIFLLFFVTITTSQLGCAVKSFGKADVTAFNINLPSELNGQTKSSIMQNIGNPDYVMKEGEIEYWGYRNNRGWYLEPFGGKTEAKDLILELQNEKVKTAYLIDKGSSIGILAIPALIAN